MGDGAQELHFERLLGRGTRALLAGVWRCTVLRSTYTGSCIPPVVLIAVLFETSNLTHRLFKYVVIMLVCGRSLSRIIVRLRPIRGRVLR